MARSKGLYTRGPHSFAFKYEQNFIRAEKDHAGRYPKEPERIRKGDKWIDPIAQCPELKSLRKIYQPPTPQERIYLCKNGIESSSKY